MLVLPAEPALLVLPADPALLVLPATVATRKRLEGVALTASSSPFSSSRQQGWNAAAFDDADTGHRGETNDAGYAARVAVLLETHPRFLDHDTGRGHPERPARLEAVLAGIEGSGAGDAVRAVAPRPATREELERVH